MNIIEIVVLIVGIVGIISILLLLCDTFDIPMKICDLVDIIKCKIHASIMRRKGYKYVPIVVKYGLNTVIEMQWEKIEDVGEEQ